MKAELYLEKQEYKPLDLVIASHKVTKQSPVSLSFRQKTHRHSRDKIAWLSFRKREA
jgi:hypothetical protein